MGAETNEGLASSRLNLKKVSKYLRILLTLGVAAFLIVLIVWHSNQPTEEDLASIIFYDPVQFGVEGSDTTLLVVQENGLFGYASRDGQLVIPCQFGAASPFHEGLAAVEKSHRWGYIDPSGKTVIPFRYYEALGFHGGHAFVSHRTRYVDVSDDNGDITRKALLLKAYELIDRTGKGIVDIGFFDGIGFGEGVYIAESRKLDAYFDTQGNLLLKKERESTGIFPIRDLNKDRRYEYAHLRFSCDLAMVRYTSIGDGACFMDHQGNHVIGDFLNARNFTEGLAAVQHGDPKSYEDAGKEADALWGYIDAKGQAVIAPCYTNAFPFGEGLAIVKKQDGQWAIIDTAGRETAIKGTIEQAGAFHEGMCAVAIKRPQGIPFDESELRWGSTNLLWGFTDASGKNVVPCQYDRVSAFYGGIAQVRAGGKIGYIDKNGKYVWKPR